MLLKIDALVYDGPMSACGECERLEQQEARRLRLYREQLQIDRELRVNDTDFARISEQRLLESYELVAAQRRIHLAQEHPDSRQGISLNDLNTVILKGKQIPAKILP